MEFQVINQQIPCIDILTQTWIQRSAHRRSSKVEITQVCNLSPANTTIDTQIFKQWRLLNMQDWFMIHLSGFMFIVNVASAWMQGFILISNHLCICLLQVILQSETIQELTNTSKQLSSLQHEIAILRQTADAQKAENVICTAPLTICLFPKM